MKMGDWDSVQYRAKTVHLLPKLKTTTVCGLDITKEQGQWRYGETTAIDCEVCRVEANRLITA